MTITEDRSSESITIKVEGRLDTTSAPDLENKIRDVSHHCKVLILDLSAVEYISSAGLRVVLQTHKIMAGLRGKMIVKNPSSFCRQVFEATGMDGVLSIEN